MHAQALTSCASCRRATGTECTCQYRSRCYQTPEGWAACSLAALPVCHPRATGRCFPSFLVRSKNVFLKLTENERVYVALFQRIMLPMRTFCINNSCSGRSLPGYHVAFEVSESRTPGCPPEFMNIPVPKGDPVFDTLATGKVMLPFQRGLSDKVSGQSPSNPRIQVKWCCVKRCDCSELASCLMQPLQVNLVTSWIDGSSIYGPSTSWSDSLRSFSGGRLVSGSEWNMPSQAEGPTFMWSAADPSTGEHGPHGLYGESHNVTDLL